MNENELRKLIARAADGEADAQFSLAMKYIYGDGVEENNAVAVGLLERAARQGHAEAAYNLGICYHYGYGVQENLTTAMALYEKAADGGYGKAIVMAGRFYMEGTHGERNFGKAMDCFRRAMESDDIEAVCYAEYLTGKCFAQGLGVKADAEEALRWYERAAEHGDPRAQKILEEMT